MHTKIHAQTLCSLHPYMEIHTTQEPNIPLKYQYQAKETLVVCCL